MADAGNFDNLFRGVDDDERYEGERAEKMAQLKTIHPGSPKPVGGEYRRDAFYTYSKNDHDHSSNVQVTMRPQLNNLLGRIVQMGLIPEYTSKQAIIRDAIHHRLAEIAENYADFEMSDMLAVERMDTQAQMRREHRRTVKQVLVNAQADLDELVQDGDWDDLALELDKLEMHAGDLPEKPQQKFVAMIDEYRAKHRRFSVG